MKLREDVQKNQVWTHGSMHVDHNEFIPICPEYCSDKVKKHSAPCLFVTVE